VENRSPIPTRGPLCSMRKCTKQGGGRASLGTLPSPTWHTPVLTPPTPGRLGKAVNYDGHPVPVGRQHTNMCVGRVQTVLPTINHQVITVCWLAMLHATDCAWALGGSGSRQEENPNPSVTVLKDTNPHGSMPKACSWVTAVLQNGLTRQESRANKRSRAARHY
jgi:hypothetical protein